MNRTQIIYTSLIGIILVMFSYILIMQPKVKAGNEVLEIQARIQLIEESIKEHQFNHAAAVEEKYKCIEECTTSWDKQANDEHLAADADRAEIAALNERLGLILERVKLQ